MQGVLYENSYHCFSCNRDFTAIDIAKENSKSLGRDATEEIRATDKGDESLSV